MMVVEHADQIEEHVSPESEHAGVLEDVNSKQAEPPVFADDFFLSDEDEDEQDEESSEYDDDRVEDEDWEVAERGVSIVPILRWPTTDPCVSDFTKQFNRLRQHLLVRTGHAPGLTSSLAPSTSVAPLPAVNHATTAPKTGHSKDPTANQLTALAKFSSRLAKIDVPYTMGVGINRKGPSSYANIKDKSDRATSEQVLDPRTRIILFKMIGRGLIQEVNGCISTGKEVHTISSLPQTLRGSSFRICRQTSTTLLLQAHPLGTWHSRSTKPPS
jgi:RIO kinase 1